MRPDLWAGVLIIGGLGSVARFVVDRAVARRTRATLPFGTLAVNVSGAFLLGLLTGVAPGTTVALLAGTAFLGAYTTFSTWMLETDRLAEERQIRTAAANIGVSLVSGLAAAAVGYLLGRLW